MTAPFLVQTTAPAGVAAVVLSVGYKSPLDELDLVSRDLAANNIKGTVLFDMLLANGTKNNRFLVGTFDGEHFRADGLVTDQKQRAEYAEYSAKVYKARVKEVDASLLTPAMRFALNQGTPL